MTTDAIDIRHTGWMIANAFIGGRIVGGDVSPSIDDDNRFIESYADYYLHCKTMGNGAMSVISMYKLYRTMTESISDDSLPVILTPCQKEN